MKPIIKLLLILFISNNISGQMVKSGNRWTYLQMFIDPKAGPYDPFFTSYVNETFILGNDTLIKNIQYKIVYDSLFSIHSNDVSLSILGFIREELDKKKVYFLNNNSKAGEKLIYDFNLKIGESFKFNDYMDSIKVIARDSIVYNGDKRLQLKFNYTQICLMPNNISIDSLVWIEAIGSNLGFHDMYGFTYLLCFNSNGTLKYKNPYNLECEYIPLAINQKILSKVSLFPNPASDFVDIKSPVILKDIKLFNLNGQKIASYRPLQKKYQIKIQHLKPGIYYLKVDNQFFKLLKE